MQVWINSVTPITPTELGAIDLDTPPDQLIYEVLPAQNGYLATGDDVTSPIMTFTQDDVNNGNVMFVHSGKSMTS